jgi:hypothetical protein
MANTPDKVIKVAEAEIGYLEKKSNYKLDDKTANAGSNNYTKYGRDMHKLYPSVMDFPAAWCDCFVDWCFQKAYGVSTAKSLLGGNFDDYTVASAQMYKNKGAWYTKDPKVGDQIFFKNDVRICHTGIVYAVDSKKVYTIEGNTSGASGVVANGGGVWKKAYWLNSDYIAGYGRPKYDGVAQEAKPVVTTKVDSAKSFSRSIAGDYSTTANLNMRSGAGVSKSIIDTIPKGKSVKCYGYYTTVSGVKWYLIKYNNATGFVSSKYLTK